MAHLSYDGLVYLCSKLKERFAQKNHTHDDRYYTENELNYKLTNKADRTIIQSDGDLNGITSAGFYNCAKGNTVTNKPYGVGAFGLVVVYNDNDNNNYTQILTTAATGKTYRRNCVNGTWGSWSQDKYTDTNNTISVNENASNGNVKISVGSSSLPVTGGGVAEVSSNNATDGIRIYVPNPNSLLEKTDLYCNFGSEDRDNVGEGNFFKNEDTKDYFDTLFNNLNKLCSDFDMNLKGDGAPDVSTIEFFNPDAHSWSGKLCNAYSMFVSSVSSSYMLASILFNYTTTNENFIYRVAMASAYYMQKEGNILQLRIVDTLPAVNEAEKNTLYLVKKKSADATIGDAYDKYLFVNGAFEKIGMSTMSTISTMSNNDIDDILKTM